MNSPHHHPSIRIALGGLLLSVLATAGCNGSRTSTFAPEAAPSSSVERITIRIERITRYEGGIDLHLAIDNRSTTPVRFPRMQSSFPTLRVTAGGSSVPATRIERGARMPFAEPYTVAAGTVGRLAVQFTRSDAPAVFLAQARHGAGSLAWAIELPAVR